MTHGGGFTGLVISTTVDSAALTPDEAETLRAKVDEAGLVDLAPASDQPAYPDGGQYELTVQDEGRSRTVVLHEQDLSPAVRSLIIWLQSVPAREETVEPPG